MQNQRKEPDMHNFRDVLRLVITAAILCAFSFELSLSTDKTIGAGHKVIRWHYPDGAYYEGGYYRIGKEMQAGYDIYRDLMSFSLDLPGNQSILSASLSLTISPAYQTGTWTKATVTNCSSLDPSSSLSTIWAGVKNGGALFSDLVYSQTQNLSLSSDGLLTIVRQAYGASKPVQLGIYAQVEDSTQSLAQVFAELDITYQQANFAVKVENSFGSGIVRVDGLDYASGTTLNFQNGSQHTLEAVNNQTSSSDGITTTYTHTQWEKNLAFISYSNPLTVTVSQDAGYMARFSGSATLTGTHTVATGNTLKFEPLTTVNCSANAKIMVYGTLLAQGGTNTPITFTTPSGYWQGIEFSGGNGSALTNCQINFATSPIVATNTSSLLISSCTIGNSNFYGTSPVWSQAAIALYGSAATITSTSINGRGDSWNGVRFAQGSTGGIYYSTVQNCGAGNGIVVQGGSSPAIQYCNIVGNYYNGIYVLGNGAGYPTIKFNYLANNGMPGGQYYCNGIVVSNSSSMVYFNDISLSNAGLVSYNYGSVDAGDRSEYPGTEGKNTIVGCNYGLLAQYSSYMDFGYYESYYGYCPGGCSNIYQNNWGAAAYSASNIWAVGNYWGYQPNFYFDGSSHIHSDMALGDIDMCIRDGGPAAASPIVSDGTSTLPKIRPADDNSDLGMARKARRKKDYEEATAKYKSALSNGAPSLRQSTLAEYFTMLRQAKNPSIVQEMQAYAAVKSDLQDLALQLLANAYVVAGRFNEAASLAMALRPKYAGQLAEKDLLVLIASLKSFDNKLSSTSDQAIAELEDKFGIMLEPGLLVALGINAGSNQSNDKAAIEPKDELLSCYPNPFNPTTNIRFKLTANSHVSLKIYDILGRVIITLLDGQRAPGVHTVAWDGSRFASGMYLVRLEFPGKVLTQKLLLMK